MMKNNNKEQFIEECRKILEESNELEEVLLFLRRKKNLGKLASAGIIATLFDLKLSDAVKEVHESGTWLDLKEFHEEFETKFLSLIELEDDFSDLNE